jgi:hypothetical protein
MSYYWRGIFFFFAEINDEEPGWDFKEFRQVFSFSCHE